MRGAVPAVLAAAALLAAGGPDGIAAAAPAQGAPPAPARGKPTEAEAAAKFLAPFLKRKAFRARDPEEIRKRLDPMGEEALDELRRLVEAVPAADRGAAAPEVVRMVDEALLARRFGAAALALPDAVRRFADPDPGARCRLLADASRLEDAGPATRLALWAAESTNLQVRLRAVDTLADLLSYAGDAARLLPALRKALDDPSPAVRDLALERLENMADGAALEWALAHALEPAAEEVEVRERKERRCPGDRAFLLLARVSKTHTGVEPSDARALPEAERAELLGSFRAWREAAGPRPLLDLGDGPFDPVPRVTTVVAAKDATEASARWWSEIDRAQFHLALDEMDAVAASPLDWVCRFRAVAVASGARDGTWEAYARGVRCGERHRFARRGFALVETTIQPLLDGRRKVFVRAYEWRSGR